MSSDIGGGEAMTAPTYTQQQTPQQFGQAPGYDPFNPLGTSAHGFGGGFGQLGYGQGGYGQGGYGQGGYGQLGQQWGQQGGDVYTLVWQLLGNAQQSIQLAQQLFVNSIQQQQQQQQQNQFPMINQSQWQNPFGPRGFQRQPMAW
jgi:hypothetical protein